MGIIGLMLAVCGANCPLHGQTAPGAPVPAQAQVSSQEPASASAPAGPPPGIIYKEAMHPLDVVRSSMDNWSDAEVGALVAGMHTAKEACDQAKPESYTGDDLYDLARLCSFGQDWNAANAAALQYVARGEKPHMAQSYMLSMSALVHMSALDLAEQTAGEMLDRLPYDAVVADAYLSMKDYLIQIGDPKALSLAAEEHTAIVKALAQNVPLKDAYGDRSIGLGALCQSAMELAFLQRYAGDDRAAAVTVADVDGALKEPAQLPAEDQQRILSVTTQYGLLGARLPEIKVLRALRAPAARAQINPDWGFATVLVLFPDWCVQCRKMMTTMTSFAAVNGDTPIHAYGLIFTEDGGEPLPEKEVKELRGTLTMEVPAETRRSFGAIDYPLGIVVDKAGLIRYIGVLPGGAFDGGGFVEKLITRMAAKTGATPKTQ
jgi:hypothetical protein